MRLFVLATTKYLGKPIAGALGAALSQHEERDFEDGERKARPLVSVRGADAYLVQSLHGEPAISANDKLVRLLFFMVKHLAAARSATGRCCRQA